MPVEVPLPDDLPAGLLREPASLPGACSRSGCPETHLTPEMKANYADGSRKLLEQIDLTEKLLTFPCTPVKVTKDIIKKGLKEVIKNLPTGSAEEVGQEGPRGARRLLLADQVPQ